MLVQRSRSQVKLHSQDDNVAKVVSVTSNDGFLIKKKTMCFCCKIENIMSSNHNATVLRMLIITYSHIEQFVTKSSSHQDIWSTFAIMAVFAPSLAAITHWFAPFPPKPIENWSPWSVSPTLGNRGTLLHKCKATYDQQFNILKLWAIKKSNYYIHSSAWLEPPKFLNG